MSSQVRLQRSIDAMGSTFSVVLYGEDMLGMERAVDAAFTEVERVESMLSNYRPESEWSHVNRHAADGPVPISDELFELLSGCVEYSRRSDGAFDISVSPLVKVWGFDRRGGALPLHDEAAAAHRSVGYRCIDLDRVRRTIHFQRVGMAIDPGGIGKGYAVDRVAAILRGRGFTTALIAASGSTIFGMGAPPSEPRGWPVRVRHPARPLHAVAEVFLKDMSLSTSGAGERSFAERARVYSHVIDPRTGEPADDILVATLAPNGLDGEAWTKACLLNGLAWAAANPVDGCRILCFEGPDGAGSFFPSQDSRNSISIPPNAVGRAG